jgi:hypothetical protein
MGRRGIVRREESCNIRSSMMSYVIGLTTFYPCHSHTSSGATHTCQHFHSVRHTTSHGEDGCQEPERRSLAFGC